MTITNNNYNKVRCVNYFDHPLDVQCYTLIDFIIDIIRKDSCELLFYACIIQIAAWLCTLMQLAYILSFLCHNISYLQTTFVGLVYSNKTPHVMLNIAFAVPTKWIPKHISMDSYLREEVERRFWLAIRWGKIANQVFSVRLLHSCSTAFGIISNP